MKLLFSILFLSVPFLVGAQVPVVNSFSPTRGGMGTNVVIKGANFTGTTNVSFGGTPAASFIVDSSGGITAIVGQGSPGFLPPWVFPITLNLRQVSLSERPRLVS